MVYLSPLLALSTVYLCWVSAWAQLGHQPRPLLDDPKYIGGVVDVTYGISILGVMFLPAFLILGLVSCWLYPTKPRPARIKKGFNLASIYFMFCVTCWAIARVDPGKVFYWWFD